MPSCAAVQALSMPSCAAVQALSMPSCAAVQALSMLSCAAVQALSMPSCAAVQALSELGNKKEANNEMYKKQRTLAMDQAAEARKVTGKTCDEHTPLPYGFCCDEETHTVQLCIADGAMTEYGYVAGCPRPPVAQTYCPVVCSPRSQCHRGPKRCGTLVQ